MVKKHSKKPIQPSTQLELFSSRKYPQPVGRGRIIVRWAARRPEPDIELLVAALLRIIDLDQARTRLIAVLRRRINALRRN